MICFSLLSWLQLFQAHFSLSPVRLPRAWGPSEPSTSHFADDPPSWALCLPSRLQHSTGPNSALTTVACPKSCWSFLRWTDLHLSENFLSKAACHQMREKQVGLCLILATTQPALSGHRYLSIHHNCALTHFSFQSVLEQRWGRN